ncbi:hypothetical protein, partial [Pseudoalteromonas byunsanensis]
MHYKKNNINQIDASIPEEHYTKLVFEWNDTDKAYPQANTLAQLFSAQAQLCPDAIALVYEHEQVSYQALDDASNRLAREIRAQYLASHGHALTPGTLIGVYLERSVNM